VPVVGTGSGGSGLSWSSVPASATATGTAGQIAYDGNYFYIATGVNTWARSQILPGPFYRAFDSFTSLDATTIASRALESGTAMPKTWASSLVGTNASNSVIRSNTLQADGYAGSGNNNYSFSTVNCGASDGTITTTFVLGSREVNYSYAGVTARFTDTNNRIQVMAIRSGSDDVGIALRLSQISGGTSTSLATAGTGTSLTLGTAYTMTVVLSGTSITATLSNGLSVSGTSSVNQSGTTHGVFIGHTADPGSGSVTYMDNFGFV
jgi:hypothetical protein